MAELVNSAARSSLLNLCSLSSSICHRAKNLGMRVVSTAAADRTLSNRMFRFSIKKMPLQFFLYSRFVCARVVACECE